MADIQSYPHVLIVRTTKVRADDPGNLLIRARFGDWPKDRRNCAQRCLREEVVLRKHRFIMVHHDWESMLP